MDSTTDYVLLSSLQLKVTEYTALHLWSNATLLCDLIISLSKNDPKWIQRMASMWYAAGKYDNALEVLTRLQTSHPEAFDASCAFLSAQCHQQQADWMRCNAVLSNILGGKEVTMESLRAANLKDLAAPVAYLRGQCLEHIGDRKNAAEHYFVVLAIDPYFACVVDRLTDGYLVTPAHCLSRFEEIIVSPTLRAIYMCKIRPLPAAAEVTTTVPESRVLGPLIGPSNWYLQLCEAQRLYEMSAPHRALKITTQLIRTQLQNETCLGLHITLLVCLKRISEIHWLAHTLVGRYPSRAVTWYAVGCFYYASANYEKAGSYFDKATQCDNDFMPAWIAYGHCCYYLEEGEQALKAYRNVQRLFPGSHLGCLYIGMQCSRSLSWKTAAVYLDEAHRMCPSDALILNELGVMAFRHRQMDVALRHFLAAVALCPYKAKGVEGAFIVPPPVVCDYWEPMFFNLACTYRKIRHYAEAIQWYEMCLIGLDGAAHVYTALGFTYHISGDVDNAIEYYHKSLSVKSTDTFVHNMIKYALKERYETGVLFETCSRLPVPHPLTPPAPSSRPSTRYSSYNDIARAINPSPFTRPSTTMSQRDTTMSERTEDHSTSPSLQRQLQF